MVSVLERLRAALAPGIAVEREIARGGMGILFLGRDTVLDRQVANATRSTSPGVRRSGQCL